MPRSITILPSPLGGFGDVKVAVEIYKALKKEFGEVKLGYSEKYSLFLNRDFPDFTRESDADLTIHFPANSPQFQESLPELLKSGKKHLLLNEYGFGTTALVERERFKGSHLYWHAFGVGEDELGLVFEKGAHLPRKSELGPYHFGYSTHGEMKELFVRTVVRKKEGDLSFVFVGAPLDLSKLNNLEGVAKIESFYADGVPVEMKIAETGRLVRIYNFTHVHEEEMRDLLYGSERETLVTGDHSLVEALLLGHYPFYELRRHKRGFVYDLASLMDEDLHALLETFPIEQAVIGEEAMQRAITLMQRIQERDHLWKGFALKLYREFHFAPRLVALIHSLFEKEEQSVDAVGVALT